jgi:hypothetical protein
MLRMAFLATAALVFVAGSAQAGGRCSQPYAPVIKISASASKQEMTSLREDVSSFIAASDVYQKCLTAQGGGESMIDANQSEKERVGRLFNTLVRTFKTTHPG